MVKEVFCGDKHIANPAPSIDAAATGEVEEEEKDADASATAREKANDG